MKRRVLSVHYVNVLWRSKNTCLMRGVFFFQRDATQPREAVRVRVCAYACMRTRLSVVFFCPTLCCSSHAFASRDCDFRYRWAKSRRRTRLSATPVWHKYHHLSVLCNTASVNPYFPAPYQICRSGDGWDQGYVPLLAVCATCATQLYKTMCLLSLPHWEWRHWALWSTFTTSLDTVWSLRFIHQFITKHVVFLRKAFDLR